MPDEDPPVKSHSVELRVRISTTIEGENVRTVLAQLLIEYGIAVAGDNVPPGLQVLKLKDGTRIGDARLSISRDA